MLESPSGSPAANSPSHMSEGTQEHLALRQPAIWWQRHEWSHQILHGAEKNCPSWAMTNLLSHGIVNKWLFVLNHQALEYFVMQQILTDMEINILTPLRSSFYGCPTQSQFTYLFIHSIVIENLPCSTHYDNCNDAAVKQTNKENIRWDTFPHRASTVDPNWWPRV